jgi:MFS family permease
VLSDRLGTRFLPAAGMALLVVAHLLAAVIAPGLVAVVYAVVLGAMGGAVRTAASTLLPSWFGTGHLGSIQGLLSFFNVAASAVGPVALAVAQAGFDSYAPAVLMLSAIPGAALVFSLRDDSTSLRPVVH